MIKKDIERVSDRVLDYLGGAVFFFMILLIGINVLSLWITGRRYAQLEELVLSGFVWVTYISIGNHYRKKQHIAVDFLVGMLRPKARKTVEIISDIIVLIVGVIVLFGTWKLLGLSIDKYTPLLKLRFLWIDLGLFLGFVSLVGNIIVKYIPSGKEKIK